MAGPVIEIVAPTRTARAGGIKTVAEFRTNERLGAAEAVQYQSLGSDFPEVSEHLCYTGEADPEDKAFEDCELEDAIGAPFPLYSGVRTYMNAGPGDMERAAASLGFGEDRGLEEALATWAAGGTALTGGGSVMGAIAVVEQSLDAGYLGRGVLLMARSDAVRALSVNALVREGDTLATATGTPVIASGVVTAGTVYGLGAVLVERSAVATYATDDVQFNRHYALAEATYVIAVDSEYRVKSATT